MKKREHVQDYQLSYFLRILHWQQISWALQNQPHFYRMFDTLFRTSINTFCLFAGTLSPHCCRIFTLFTSVCTSTILVFGFKTRVTAHSLRLTPANFVRRVRVLQSRPLRGNLAVNGWRRPIGIQFRFSTRRIRPQISRAWYKSSCHS